MSETDVLEVVELEKAGSGEVAPDFGIGNEPELVEDLIEELFEPQEPLVKNIVRYLAKNGRTDHELNTHSSLDVDAYLSYYVERGFNIVGMQYIGETGDGIGVLYTLQKGVDWS